MGKKQTRVNGGDDLLFMLSVLWAPEKLSRVDSRRIVDSSLRPEPIRERTAAAAAAPRSRDALLPPGRELVGWLFARWLHRRPLTTSASRGAVWFDCNGN